MVAPPERPGRESRHQEVAVVAAVLALLLILAARSSPRLVGDAGEYIAMSMNMAGAARPSLTPADLTGIQSIVPGEAGHRLTQPAFRGEDGRQDMVHFWFYSLLAAPFVRMANAVGANPMHGFTALNIVLLAGIALLLAARVSSAVVVLIVVSPIVWWIDKAHTEVFTFSCLSAGLLLLRTAPWWSIVALGAASTQNPPIAVAMGIVTGCAFLQRGVRDRRLWFAAIAGGAMAVLHPVYYYSRLGIWSGLAGAVDRHVPSMRELVAVAFDLNLGVFMYAPLLALAMIVALVDALRYPERRVPDVVSVAMCVIVGLFLLSFTQTANLNSGGTPGPSRYGLWLVPFAIPILASVRANARWLRVLSVASGVWCLSVFAPSLPERYLEPSSLASYVWERWPGVDNPLAEVFAERVTGRESAAPPMATPGCEKVLLLGDGGSALWPGRCTAVALPDFCRSSGALCYANEYSGSYDFVRAPATPGWRAGLASMSFIHASVNTGMLLVTHASMERTPVAVWHDEGWSYPEQLATPMPDDVFREWRWIDDRALVGVNSERGIDARLEFVARAFRIPRRMRVLVGGQEVMTQTVPANIGSFRTGEFRLPAGRTMVTFESLDGSEAPDTADPRRLSIQVYRIELVVVR